jgi:single-strand DNA-binding protein
MANGMNQVILLGNIGRDPEFRPLNSGNSVLSFSLATSSSRKTKEGEWKEETEWHSIKVWGARAAGLAKFLEKGRQVMIKGRIKTSQYEKDGVTRYRVDIMADDVIVCGGAGTADTEKKSSSPEFGEPKKSSKGAFSDSDYGLDNDDDIPF